MCISCTHFLLLCCCFYSLTLQSAVQMLCLLVQSSSIFPCCSWYSWNSTFPYIIYIDMNCSAHSNCLFTTYIYLGSRLAALCHNGLFPLLCEVQSFHLLMSVASEGKVCLPANVYHLQNKSVVKFLFCSQLHFVKFPFSP